MVSDNTAKYSSPKGDFAVMSETPYVERDERQWLTRGSFYLKPLEDHQVDCTNLTASGFPFCRAGIHVRAKRYINRNGTINYENDMIAKFEAENPGIKVEVQRMSMDDYNQTIQK